MTYKHEVWFAGIASLRSQAASQLDIASEAKQSSCTLLYRTNRHRERSDPSSLKCNNVQPEKPNLNRTQVGA
jgi:hypothetical protein